MRVETWRPASVADLHRITDLFSAVEAAQSVELERAESEVHARLTRPGLVLATDTLVGVDGAGALVAYAEAAVMGVADGTLRIRLTNVVHPEAGAEPLRPAQSWLVERASQLRQSHAPGGPAVLGTRCAAGDGSKLDLLTSSGWTVVDSVLDYARELDATLPDIAAPSEVSLIKYDPAYTEPARVAHNDSYAESASALLPDAASWPQHAIGLPQFLPDQSFLAVADGVPAADSVVGFLFSLDEPAAGVRSAMLHCMGTRPGWRRRGLATALIRQALTAYQRAGYRTASLQVNASNAAAVALYTQSGFAATGRGHALLTRPLR